MSIPKAINRQPRGTNPAKKRLRRKDALVKNQDKSLQGSHEAYYWLRKIKEGTMPDGRTALRKTLDAIERAITEDFRPLNSLQVLELSLLRPLLAWWIVHPGRSKKGTLASDFQWIHTRIEAGLKRIADLASAKKPRDPEDLYERWRKQFIEAQERGKKGSRRLVQPAKDGEGSIHGH
jgi:hypothetical protein